MGLFDSLFGKRQPQFTAADFARVEADLDRIAEDRERRVIRDKIRILAGYSQIYVQDAERDVAAAALRHADTLRRKRERLMRTDDYGEPDSSQWEAEVIAYARKFANFDAHEDGLTCHLRESVAQDPDLRAAAQGFAQSLKSAVVQSVEHVIGVSPARDRVRADEIADELRAEIDSLPR